MEEGLNEINERLNEIVGTVDFYKDPLEDLLVNINAYCTELIIRYKPLFTEGYFREHYENEICEIHDLLIRQCRDFFSEYYLEKLNNIYSKADKFLTKTEEKTLEEPVVETVETVETVTVEKTEETVTVEKTVEES